MMYSCTHYEAADDSLERAQVQKIDRTCRKLHLGPEDGVLETGTGWGQQCEFVRERFSASPEGEHIGLLQQDYRNLRGSYDKIASIEMLEAVKYILPGSELASVSKILRSPAAWRERFHSALDEVRALSFDDRFIRMWDYYPAYCEGAFRERHIGDFQLPLTRNHSPATLFNEPWRQGRVEVKPAGIQETVQQGVSI